MIVSDSGRTIRAKDRQPSKAFAPMDVTDSGIVTVRIPQQPQKASGAIFVTWDGKMTPCGPPSWMLSFVAASTTLLS